MEQKSKEYMAKRSYIEEVYQVQTFILNLMRYYKFEFKKQRVFIPKTGWDNRIRFNGVIGLICWENGLPMSLMTPWGEIRFVDIDWYRESKQEISPKKVEKFMKEMNAMFKLQRMSPAYKIRGLGRETYSICYLPWKDKRIRWIEMKSRYVGETEDMLLATYKEGKNLCCDILGYRPEE